MNRFRVAGAAAALVIVLPFFAIADVASDIHIGPDGVLSAKNVTVMQLAGTTIFARGTWGTTFLRMVVLTGDATTISKNHGEKLAISAVSEGDVIDVEGRLVITNEGITLNATTLRDVSLTSEQRTLAGVVTSIDVASQTFTLQNTTFGTSKVLVAGATLKKGPTVVTLTDLVKGDKVLSAVGTYDFAGNVLTATDVAIYLPKEVFVTKNFEGTLKAFTATTLPTTVTVTVGGTDYTVHLTEKSSVLKNNKAKTSLARFAVGDTVRIYGTVGDRNPKDIAAEAIRDTSF